MNHPRRLSTLVLGGALGLLAGCASTSARFEAVGPDGNIAPEARYVLESTHGHEGSITLAIDGTRDDEVDGRETDTVRAAFVIDNVSDDPIAIDLPRIAITDDAGHRYRPVATYLPPNASPDDRFQIAPRERTSFEVLFDAGAPDVLRSTGSITVDWEYAFRERAVPHRTRFLPVRYRYRESYYYPHTTFYFGYGHGFGYHRHACWW